MKEGRIKSRTRGLTILLIILFCAGNQFAQKNEIISVKIDTVTKTYRLSGSYPQMKVPADALMGVRGMMGDFNRPLQDIVTMRLTEFISSIDPVDTVQKANDNNFTLTPEVYTDNKFIFSLKMESFSEIYHSAHPSSHFDSYNFNYDAWAPFTLKDAFTDTTAALEYISDYCISDLKKQAKELKVFGADNIEKGAGRNWANFVTFNISGDRILVTFQYYQLGPRPFGAPVVSVPTDKLKKYIDPKGPLGFLV